MTDDTQWTTEQSAFISAVKDTEDSIRLDAVAGSGKTTTLVRAAKGISGHKRCIALAFNKAIADALATKFPSHVESKTMNSLGSGVWFKFQGRKNLDTKKMGSICSRWCDDNLTKQEAQEMWPQINKVATSCKGMGYIPQAAMKHCQFPAQELDSVVVEAICDANDFPFTPLLFAAVDWILRTSIAEAFESRIDFDDQVYMSTYFAPDSAWTQYHVVMVDEAQDLSKMQHDMIERLGGATGARMIVVGDERQAIYGWRGASAKSLQELEDRFNLKRMPLTVCFRCPENIIRQAQKIVPHIRAFKPGGKVEWWDSPATRPVTGPKPGDPEELNGWTTDDFLPGSVVLCRNNAPLIKMGFALIRKGKPCFFANRDIGAGLKKVIQHLEDGPNLLTSLQLWYDEEAEVLRNKRKFHMLDALTDKYDAMVAICEGCKAMTKAELSAGIDKLFLRSPGPGAIELSTIHKAKGKEWPVVYFLNVHLIPGKWIRDAFDNRVPGSADAMLQESNLQYVCETRALETLVYFTLNRDEYAASAEEIYDAFRSKESAHG